MGKINMRVDTWYYLTFNEYWINKKEYFIVGDQYKQFRHLIDKKIRKEFSSSEEKLKFRKGLFETIKRDCWYKKYFATPTQKGQIFGIMFDFIDMFIEKTLDCDYGQCYIALRNMNLNGSMDAINERNRGILDEVLGVYCGKIKHLEAGVVSIPFSAKEKDFDNWITKHRESGFKSEELPFLFSSSL